MFIKDNISVSECNELHLNLQHCEDLWVKLKFKYDKSCIVGAVYRHPKQELCKFSERFEKILSILNDKKEIYYICGDFNINLLLRETNQLIKNYSYGCIPLITHPTRITETTATLLDHIYSNNVAAKLAVLSITRHSRSPPIVCLYQCSKR